MSKNNKKLVVAKKKKTIIVFTDGSCVGNGRKNAVGGIGIHFPNAELKDVSKIYKLGLCTNQKTELYAILTALRYIKQNFDIKNYRIIINTDSQYSIDCITKWVYGWIKNGWRTQNNKPVANREFIELLHKYYEAYDIQLNHIEAHTGYDDADSLANAIADKLATRATERARLEKKNTVPSSDFSDRPAKKKKYNNNNNNNYRKPPAKFAKQKSSEPGNFPYGTNFVVELVKKTK